jgi:hypothetical protein
MEAPVLVRPCCWSALFANPRVPQLHPAVVGEKNVVGLNVSVSELGLAPAVLQCRANVDADGNRLSRVQFSKTFETRFDALPIHKLHRKPVNAIGVPGGLNLHQVRVV